MVRQDALTGMETIHLLNLLWSSMFTDAASKSFTYRKWVGTTLVYLLPEGKARSSCVIQNEGVDLFIKLGRDVSLGDYTYRIPTNGVLEIEKWAGPVTGIRSGQAGFAMCTETV